MLDEINKIRPGKVCICDLSHQLSKHFDFINCKENMYKEGIHDCAESSLILIGITFIFIYTALPT